MMMSPGSGSTPVGDGLVRERKEEPERVLRDDHAVAVEQRRLHRRPVDGKRFEQRDPNEEREQQRAPDGEQRSISSRLLLLRLARPFRSSFVCSLLIRGAAPGMDRAGGASLARTLVCG